MNTNDLKRGQRIQLANGWLGDMADNAKGDTRMVRVYGHFDDIGSVYSHDIVKAKASMDVESEWVIVTHTPKQEKLRERIKAGGF